MADHAKLSPSSAARWLTCTASVAMEEGIEDQQSSYAAEGTYAHALCELEGKYAVGQITKRQLTAAKKKIYSEEFHNAEVEEASLEYATYIKEEFRRLKKTCDVVVCEFETRLDLSKWAPGSFGTADCVIIAGDVLHVIDFKYGKGVKVEAEGNPQMMLYAGGALELYGSLYDIETVKYTIIQPRLGGVSEASSGAQELVSWLENTVAVKAEEANSGKGAFAPSESACRFCKAKAICEARAEYFLGLFDDDPEPGKLTLDRIGEILEKAKDMETWLKDLKALAYGALMEGKPVEGWKLVEGRSNRKITDEDKAAKLLIEAGLAEEDIYTKKFITLTALEKLLGAKRTAETLGDLLVKPKGQPSLAPASDKRPEVHPEEAVLNQFEEE